MDEGQIIGVVEFVRNHWTTIKNGTKDFGLLLPVLEELEALDNVRMQESVDRAIKEIMKEG